MQRDALVEMKKSADDRAKVEKTLRDKMKDDATAMRQAVRTPVETFLASYARSKELLNARAIDPETFARSNKAALDTFYSETRPDHPEVKRADAAERGSAEARALVLAAGDQQNTKRDELPKQTALLEKLNKGIADVNLNLRMGKTADAAIEVLNF
jgi:hypothetical protein